MSTIRGRAAHPMMPRKALAPLALCAIGLLGLDCRAQSQPHSQVPLESLDALTPQALAQAIAASNPDLASVAAAAEAAALRIEPAGALADPMLTYGIAPNTIGSEGNVRHIVEFSQPLPWPGKRSLRRTVAMHQAQAAAQDLEATRLDLVASAHASFAEWHYLHRAIEINAATQVLLSELTRVAEARYAAGLALQQDVLQAELETVLLEERGLSLEHDRIALRARINALLNRDPASPLPPPAAMASTAALPDVQGLRRTAEMEHPELRRIEAQVAAASSQVDLADKAFLPDFAANAGYMGIMDPSDKRLQVGVSITVPFFRARLHAELNAANADLRREQHQLDARRVGLLAEVESAYTHTHHAIEVVRLFETRLRDLADNNLQAALADYRSGAGQFINVVAAERQLLETEQRYERARADYWRMRAALDRAAGGALSATEDTPTARSSTPNNR